LTFLKQGIDVFLFCGRQAIFGTVFKKKFKTCIYCIEKNWITPEKLLDSLFKS